MNQEDRFQSVLRRAGTFFAKYAQSDQARSAASKLPELATISNQPFNLAVVGRMKTGKSTLINSLLGQQIAVMDVEEATATVNWLSYGSGIQSTHFIVHWKDGRTESCPIDRLKAEWSGKSEAVIAKVKETSRLELFCDSEKLKQIQIIDTPGTGSAVETHQNVAIEFLDPGAILESQQLGNKADAILYVTAPIGRESDIKNLQLFLKDRLYDSKPYNSVCVIHKWDTPNDPDPYQSISKNALQLKEQLGNLVSDVIPVSGPLALASRAAPDEFFGRLLEIQSQTDPKLFPSYFNDEAWDADPNRQAARKLFPAVPWASFVMILRLLSDLGTGEISTVRERCLEQSRVAHLEKFIQDRFASQSHILKRWQIMMKANQIYAPSIREITDQCARLTADSKAAAEIAVRFPTQQDPHAEWANQKSREWQALTERIKQECLELDQDWEENQGELQGLVDDLKTSEAMQDKPDLVPEEDRAIIRALCNHLASPALRSQLGRARLITLAELQQLIDRYRARANERISRSQSALFEHLVIRLEEAYTLICARYS